MALQQRVTNVSKDQVIDADFASEEELSQALTEHIQNYAHIPMNTSPNDYGKFLTVNSAGIQWGDPLPLGWKDNIVPLNAGNTGNPEYAPLFADSGNGIWGYCFADYYTNYAYCDFHINHDYLPNSLIYPHIHWMPMSYSTGNVRWVIEYTIAKGHGQNEALTGTLNQIVLLAPGKGMKGEHMVTECTELQAFSVSEPDTIVRVRIYRDGAHVDDTFYGPVMGLMVDFHYQSTSETTINKAPNFYA